MPRSTSTAVVARLSAALWLAALAAGGWADESASGGNQSSVAVPLLRKGAPGGPGSGAAATNASSEPAALEASVGVTAFTWNVHWQCSVAAQGASSTCKERIGRRFVQLAKESSAQIVTSIELSNGMSNPVSLVGLGLWGWTQVNGPCIKDGRGDSAALAFAPGWAVQRSGGGCLRDDYDTRAFAVARVAPPPGHGVEGCPTLCVIGLHAPHTDITVGKEIVSRICGDAVARCAVAMGDWNVPVEGLGHFWGQLVDGAAPTVAAPNERTCCFPEEYHYGVFDHVVTNVPGASLAGHHVFPYQLLEENPVQEHKPVSVSLALPAGR